MDKILYNKAIQNIFPGVGYSIEGTDYSTLGFNTGATTSDGTAIYSWTKDSNYSGPTEEEINQEYSKLLEEYPKKVIQESRATAYVKETDPLFFKYQAGEVTKEEWLVKREEIRQRYPYPS